MKFDLSKPQKLLQESATTLFQRQCSLERVRELMETESAADESLWAEYVDQGWTGLVFPEALDGLELGVVELAALMEAMGKACIPGPYLAAMSAGVLLDELRDHDLAAQRLREQIEGETRLAVAWHESSPNWDPDSIQLSLGRGAGRIVLDGEKTLVPGVLGADWILVVVKDEEEKAVLAVPASAHGVEVKASPGIDKSRPLGQVTFRGVDVKEDNILARGKVAEKAIERFARVGAVMACADMVGGMQWMMEAAVEYAKTREQFDRPIGSYQMIQEQCADMLLMIESSRSATYYAAWALDEGDPDTERAVSMAKAYCSDASREIGNRSIQVHGGIGFTWEHDLHLFYKRAKASELLFGDATFHRERLAQSLLDG